MHPKPGHCQKQTKNSREHEKRVLRCILGGIKEKDQRRRSYTHVHKWLPEINKIMFTPPPRSHQ